MCHAATLGLGGLGSGGSDTLMYTPRRNVNRRAGFALDRVHVHVNVHTYIRFSVMRCGKLRGHEVSTSRVTRLLKMLLVVPSVRNLHGLVVPKVTVHPLVKSLGLGLSLCLAIVVPMLLMRMMLVLVLVIHHGH